MVTVNFTFQGCVQNKTKQNKEKTGDKSVALKKLISPSNEGLTKNSATLPSLRVSAQMIE